MTVERLFHSDGTPSAYTTSTIRGRADGDPDVDIDAVALGEAIARWRRGEVREALYQLEKALDGHFYGLSDLKPDQLK